MRPILNNLVVSVLVGAAVSGLLVPKPIATSAANSDRTNTGVTYAYAATPDFTTGTVKASAVLPQTARFRSQVIGETPLDIWLDSLEQKESNDDPYKRIVDVNGYYSYGCLQFQMPTFKNFIYRYDLQSEIKNGDWLTAIYNCGLQRRLAKLMLIENINNWRQWYNSVKYGELGMPPVGQQQ